MSADWRPVRGFSSYSVSKLGEIKNADTGRILKPSIAANGDLKLTLVSDTGERLTRSVRVIVAVEFVPPMNSLHNTVMLLDNNHLNVSAANLVWRPRHYVWQYSAQFTGVFPFDIDRPIVDKDDDTIFRSIKFASIARGVLAKDIYSSATYKKRTPVTDNLFSWIE